MQTVDHVSLRFYDNGVYHDDLVLQVGTRRWRADSYYLHIDSAVLPDDEGAPKVREVLKRLIEQWCAAATGLSEGASCYLPYDFSDECTGWLRCEASGPTLTIQPGWADVNGYSVLPSRIGEYLRQVPGFRPDGEAVAIARAAFLRSIRGAPPAE